MSNPITGLFKFAPQGGAAVLCATTNGRFFTYDGSRTITNFTGATISTTSPVTMIQANDVIYGTDGVNPPFKFDGTYLTTPNVLDASGNEFVNVTDILWYMDRMWWAVDDYVYFSEVGSPETISDAPIRARLGAGDALIRVMSYRDSYILVWKSGLAGIGSVQVFDVGTNDPTQFSGETVPLFEHESVVSPRCIIRTGVRNDSDIIYNSREGLRSLTFTSLDKLTFPSLPLTQNLPSVMDSINYFHINTAHCQLFDDELLFWIPTGSAVTPNICLGYSMKIPRDNVQQGWVQYDMMPATCSCIASLDGTKPKLYLGTVDGNIQEAFARSGDGETTYREVGKRITFDSDMQDKTPQKLILIQDTGAIGDVDAYINFDDGEQRYLGTQSYSARGLTLPQTLPDTLPNSGITTNFSDIQTDGDGNLMRPGKDFRVEFVSTGMPQILGYQLEAIIEPTRYIPVEQSPQTTELAAVTAAEGSVTSQDYKE